MDGEQPDGTAGKWDIRGVSHEARNAAKAAAKRDGMDLGPWIGRAILTAIQADRQSDRAPVIVRPEPAPGPTVDLGELERMMALAQQMRAITDKPPPRTITGPLSRLLRTRLRGMAGG